MEFSYYDKWNIEDQFTETAVCENDRGTFAETAVSEKDGGRKNLTRQLFFSKNKTE